MQQGLTLKDLSLLKNTECVNDIIINEYMKLLGEFRKELNSKHFPPCYIYSTFFYPFYQEQGYGKVARWTRKINIPSMSLLLFPIFERKHWTLAYFNFNQKQMGHLDSLRSRDMTILEDLQSYLKEEYKERAEKTTSLDFENWTIATGEGIPKQENSTDCGVFVCCYARMLILNDPKFREERDSQKIRNHIAYELKEGKLYVM